jgi:zinc transporter ZupT
MLQLDTGMSVASAFLLVGASAAAFVAGGAMVFSAHLLSLAQPLPLVVLFSTSSFVFVYSALAQLFRYSHTGYTDLLLSQSPDDLTTVDGLGQLFTIISMILGGLLLYTVDALIYRLTTLAADCYGETSLPQRQHQGQADVRSRGSVTEHELTASGYGANLHTSSGFHGPQYHGSQLPDMYSTTASPYEQYTASMRGLRVRGTILSALAVSLHHIPGTFDLIQSKGSKGTSLLTEVVLTAGLALYVAAVLHLPVGVAVATAIVLHSLPDGIALASSIYFASGHRLRGVFWCLLSPVGKLMGAVLAWVLVGPATADDRLKHALATGIAAGVLLGVGIKEVMPTIHVYAEGKAHGTVLGVMVGILVVAATRFISL